MNNFQSTRGGARCQATMGSVTLAMKAKRTLASANIPSDVVKLKARNAASRGCIYGIEYPCELAGNVQRLLAEADLKPR